MSFILKQNEEGGLWVIKNHRDVMEKLRKQMTFQNRLIDIQKKYDIPDESLTFFSYGGQGIIYKGYSHYYRDTLSIKLPFYNPYELDSSKENALLREANIIKLFRDVFTQYIPKLYDYEPTGKYLIKKFYDFPELGELIDGEELEREKLCFSLVKQFKWICSFLNKKGKQLILTDWKVSNILLNLNNYQPLLIDLGNTKNYDQILPDYTLSISKIGSRHFVHWPPELLLGEKLLCGPWCNSFILGVQLYYIMVGEYPYLNDAMISSLDELLSIYNAKYYKAQSTMVSLLKKGIVGEELGEFIISLINPDYSNRGGFYD